MTKGIVRQAALEGFQKSGRVLKNAFDTLAPCTPLGGPFHCRLGKIGDLRVAPGVAESRAPGDAPLLEVGALKEGGIINLLIRKGRPVAGVRTCDDGKHQRRIDDATRHWAKGGQGAVGRGRIHGNAPAARLEAKDPAEACRNTDRAAGICSQCERSETGRYGCSGSSTRAAG